MSEKQVNPQVEAQRQEIVAARTKGKLASIKTFIKYSGPGWLQSATTLGGGTLASSLYLGVLGGFCFMWLQPFAMILGVIMLAAISYVTLSIEKKPMHAINKEITPILGYAWAIGSMLACTVFAMPQFSLGVASIEQNLAVETFKNTPFLAEYGKILITVFFFLLAFFMVSIYVKGGKGIKIFEYFVKGSVAAIVLCFFAVVIYLSVYGKINWSYVWNGFVPSLSVLSEPSAQFMEYINKLGEDGKSFWSGMIVGQQRDVVISAAAMAVGINMTFLYPYSMLKKGWGKDFRGLAIFDLATGLFIPFMIATSCVVIASASEFHAKPAKGLTEIVWQANDKLDEKSAFAKFACEPIYSETAQKPAPNLVKPYLQLLQERNEAMLGKEAFSKLSNAEKVAKYNATAENEKEMAAMLVKRDAINLADTLAPLLGDTAARYIFGFGVFGMAMNAVLMNMLICGLCFSEIIGKGGQAKWHLLGSCLIIFSACASLFWEGAKMWLVINAGVMAMVLLHIAYGAFHCIMNSKKILGDAAPRGGARFVWNVLMCLSLTGSSVASLYVLTNKLGALGPAIFFAFLLIVLVGWGLKNLKKA